MEDRTYRIGILEDDIVIIAATEREGWEYAKAHGIDRRNVAVPGRLHRLRGRSFDDFTIVGDIRLDVIQWSSLTSLLLGAGEEVLDRLQWEALGKLPPPIELERENVPRF